MSAEEYFIKILVVGENLTEKAPLAIQFADGSYPGFVSKCPTRYADLKFGEKSLSYEIEVLADTEGLKSVDSIDKRTSQAIIVCFDVNNRSTFDAVDKYFDSLDLDSKIIKVMVGAGIEVDESKRMVTSDKIKAKAEKLNIDYFEVNCKDTDQVRKVFISLGEKYLAQQIASDSSTTEDRGQSNPTNNQNTQSGSRSGNNRCIVM